MTLTVSCASNSVSLIVAVFGLSIIEAESDSCSGARGCNQEKELDELTFKLVVKPKEREGTAISIVLMAPSAQEKSAWTGDIGQVSDTRRARTRTRRLSHRHLQS